MQKKGINRSIEPKIAQKTSINGALEQVRANRGPGSHRKWSIVLEAQKSSLSPKSKPGNTTKNPVTQELRTSWWHTLLFMMMG